MLPVERDGKKILLEKTTLTVDTVIRRDENDWFIQSNGSIYHCVAWKHRGITNLESA